MGQFRKTSDPRQRSSGLTMADFIVETGISNTSLYKWRQRLINESTYDPTKPVATHMTVRVAGDRRSIDVPIDFDDDALRRLVEVLESC